MIYLKFLMLRVLHVIGKYRYTEFERQYSTLSNGIEPNITCHIYNTSSMIEELLYGKPVHVDFG